MWLKFLQHVLGNLEQHNYISFWSRIFFSRWAASWLNSAAMDVSCTTNEAKHDWCSPCYSLDACRTQVEKKGGGEGGGKFRPHLFQKMSENTDISSKALIKTRNNCCSGSTCDIVVTQWRHAGLGPGRSVKTAQATWCLTSRKQFLVATSAVKSCEVFFRLAIHVSQASIDERLASAIKKTS